MKSLKLSKVLQMSLVASALSTVMLILPVSAQVNPSSPDTTTPTTIERTDDVYDNNLDWGWLGLFGLFGLLGLKRKPENVAYRRDINSDPATSRNDYTR